jgi:hypothetical protein
MRRDENILHCPGLSLGHLECSRRTAADLADEQAACIIARSSSVAEVEPLGGIRIDRGHGAARLFFL